MLWMGMGGHGWTHVMLWVGMGGYRSMLMVMVWVWVQIRRKMLGSSALVKLEMSNPKLLTRWVGQSLIQFKRGQNCLWNSTCPGRPHTRATDLTSHSFWGQLIFPGADLQGDQGRIRVSITSLLVIWSRNQQMWFSRMAQSLQVHATTITSLSSIYGGCRSCRCRWQGYTFTTTLNMWIGVACTIHSESTLVCLQSLSRWRGWEKLVAYYGCYLSAIHVRHSTGTPIS